VATSRLPAVKGDDADVAAALEAGELDARATQKCLCGHSWDLHNLNWIEPTIQQKE